jgi:uncharacterized repeat protein (TIGR01451 family)
MDNISYITELNAAGITLDPNYITKGYYGEEIVNAVYITETPNKGSDSATSHDQVKTSTKQDEGFDIEKDSAQDGAYVVAGGSIDYTIRVTNTGTVTIAAKDSVITDTLPAAVYLTPDEIGRLTAEYGESMTFVAAAANCIDQQTKSVADLFRLVGQVKVCEERMIAPGMMMAGCGIAYVMRYLRAQMEGGVEMGFYPADALSIALQTMQGAVTLLKETGLHPEAAIDKVTTPGGTTIKGLNELDHSGFNSAVINSLKAGLK